MENVIFSFMSYIKGTMHWRIETFGGGGGGGGGARAVSQTLRLEGPITIFFFFKVKGALQKKNTN